MSLIVHTKHLPSFGFHLTDQSPVTIHTVLSINDEVGDCAAYRGVSPLGSDDAVIEKVRRGGNKISEAEARQMFPEIEAKKLRYRR